MRAAGIRGSVRAAATACAAGVLLVGSVSACSGENKVPSIGYAFDNAITTYNANTVEGASSGAAVAFPRVLTGPYYIGPVGQPLADTDYGTAKEVPGETLTVQYKLHPDAVYSDGVPTSCDDLVLEWAARSGRFTRGGSQASLFDAADTAGYSDIDRVECQAGAKDATVVFRPGRRYLAWRTLFGATDLMPAHVLAKAVGVPDVVGAIASGNNEVIRRIAEFWNTGWQMTPEKLDLSLFPSSGPYRVESFSDDDGLVLVANDRWWGNKPSTGRIVLWPKNTDLKVKVAQKAVEVIDIGANSVDGLDLPGFVSKNHPSRNTEQLILATGGIFEKADARKAFALCVPRRGLFDQVGHPDYSSKQGLGSDVLNSRIVAQDELIYSAVAVGGNRYPGNDAPGASAALARADLADLTVRVGYLGPDARRAKEVTMLAGACKSAGINVVDAGSARFTVQALRDGKADAVLAGTAGAAGAGGTLDGVDARYALKTTSGADLGKYSSGRYNTLVDQLATDDSVNVRLNASAEAETLLWNDIPSIPLFDQPRTIAFGDGMQNTVANPNKSGSGWNMDRWILKR